MENLAVEALRTRWPAAERRAQRGVKDAGDISGVPFTVEVKNVKKFAPAEWWKEAQQESKHNGNLPAVVIAKRRGSANPMEQWVITDMRTWLTSVDGYYHPLPGLEIIK